MRKGRQSTVLDPYVPNPCPGSAADLWGPLCSHGDRVSVAGMQCRQRMGQGRENRATACSSIPCSVSTALLLHSYLVLGAWRHRGPWGNHITEAFLLPKLVLWVHLHLNSFPLNVNVLGILCWTQLHRLEFQSHFEHLKMETWEGVERMWTGRVTFQHCRVLLWLGPFLEASLISDHLHLPPKPSGSQQSHWNLGGQVLFLFILQKQFLTKCHRDISCCIKAEKL